jgi:hypothetical protein
MHGLAAICHEARKGGHAGSRWPTHYCAPSLLDTSEAALKRFFGTLTAADPVCAPSDPAPPRGPAASTRARRRAEKTLAAVGI